MSTEPAPRATARLGLRERKKLATRDAIGGAAVHLAVERGLENITVEDIAAAANVSPRTFNNYFSSKLEAISALGIDRTARIGAALCGRPASEPLWEAITAAVLEHYDTIHSPQGAWKDGMRRVLLSPAMRGEYLKTNAAMQRARFSRADARFNRADRCAACCTRPRPGRPRPASRCCGARPP